MTEPDNYAATSSDDNDDDDSLSDMPLIGKSNQLTRKNKKKKFKLKKRNSNYLEDEEDVKGDSKKEKNSKKIIVSSNKKEEVLPEKKQSQKKKSKTIQNLLAKHIPEKLARKLAIDPKRFKTFKPISSASDSDRETMKTISMPRSTVNKSSEFSELNINLEGTSQTPESSIVSDVKISPHGFTPLYVTSQSRLFPATISEIANSSAVMPVNFLPDENFAALNKSNMNSEGIPREEEDEIPFITTHSKGVNEKRPNTFKVNADQKYELLFLEREKFIRSYNFSNINKFWIALFIFRLLMMAGELTCIMFVFRLPRETGKLLSMLPTFDDEKQRYTLTSWFSVSGASNLLGAVIAFNSKNPAMWDNRSFIAKSYIFWLALQLAIHLVGLMTCTLASQNLPLSIVPPDMKIFLAEYTTNESIRHQIDGLQLNNSCCGMVGPVDWVELADGKSTKLPKSCCRGMPMCRHIFGNKIRINRNETREIDGCYDILMNEIELDCQIKSLVFGVLIVLQIPLFFLTLNSLPNLKLLNRYYKLVQDFKADTVNESIFDLPNEQEMLRINSPTNKSKSGSNLSSTVSDLSLRSAAKTNNANNFANNSEFDTGQLSTFPNEIYSEIVSVEPSLREITEVQRLTRRKSKVGESSITLNTFVS